jgi:hypothetical protein
LKKAFPYKNVKRLVLTVLLMLKALMALTVLTVLKVLVNSSRERAPAIIMLRDAVLLSLSRGEEKEWAAVCTGKAGDGHESWSRRRRRSQRERQAAEVAAEMGRGGEGE